MTSTFLGKWRLYIPNSWSGGSLDAYASYTPSDGRKNSHHAVCLWFIRNGALPAGKEINIAFILRSDSQLCFQLNNGKYVDQWMGFADTLAEATGFTFPGSRFSLKPT